LSNYRYRRQANDGADHPYNSALRHRTLISLGSASPKSLRQWLLTDLQGHILARQTIAFCKTPAELTVAIRNNYATILRDAAIPRSRVRGVGITVAGIVDWELGVCRYLAALNWRDVPVSEMIGKALTLPTWVDNDANAVAVGEKFFGRARDYVNSTSIVHWGGGCLSDGMESRHLVMPLRNKSNHTTCTLFELAPSLHHSTFRKYSLGLSSKRIYNRFLLLVAGLGGLLYGLDVAIIGGALPYLEATSKLAGSQLSIMVAAVLLGSVFSTLFAGLLADWMGRKPLMVISCAVFVLSIPEIALSQATVRYSWGVRCRASAWICRGRRATLLRGVCL
jgi:hypothetical protein